MPATPAVFYRGNLPTGNSNLASAPLAQRWVVTSLILANRSSSPVQVSLALDGIEIVSAMTVGANSSAFIDTRQVLDGGKAITGSATGAMSCHISGTVVS